MRIATRTLTMIGVSVVALVALLVGTVQLASAHHADITASGCQGQVDFTAKSWAGDTTASKTNPTIVISYSLNNGASYTTLPQKPEYRFGSDNGFTFSDSFLLPGPFPTSVIVRAAAGATWGNGVVSNDPRMTPPFNANPAGCTVPLPSGAVGLLGLSGLLGAGLAVAYFRGRGDTRSAGVA